jgi:hypothetical protein
VKRTRENLEVIEKARETGDPKAHVVTQLGNSLLGLVVFPWEHQGLDNLKKRSMSAIKLEGWPDEIMEMGKDKTKTLGDFVHHMRNALAHGRIWFSSDNRNLNEVTLVLKDRKSPKSPVYWRARLNGGHLRQFCDTLMKWIESSVN